MTRYAVAYIDFFDNELSIVIAEAESPEAAIKQHPKTEIYEYSGDLAAIKEAFWNCDAAIDVIEIP